MLDEFHDLTDGVAKWRTPFPMGVFGTLRMGCGNHPLMGKDKDILTDNSGEEINEYRYRSLYSSSAVYESHHKAFMPHFAPSGLSLHYQENAAGVFEVFVYTPENWNKMIGRVDSLEGFSPGSGWRSEHSYWRSLAWLHILPDDFESEYFSRKHPWGRSNWNSGSRVLQIPVEEWDKYPRIPCWVYSSQFENHLASKNENSPIIWA